MSNFEEPRIVREEVPVVGVRPAGVVDARPVIEAQPLGARSVVEPQVVVEQAAAPIAPTRVVAAPVTVAPAARSGPRRSGASPRMP